MKALLGKTKKEPMKKLYKRILLCIGLIPILVINHYVFNQELDLIETLGLIVIL